MKCTDKKNCRVYPASFFEAEEGSHAQMLMRKGPFRVVDVIDVRYYSLDPEIPYDSPARYGKTADTGQDVEVFEGMKEGDWYAVEIEDDEEDEPFDE